MPLSKTFYTGNRARIQKKLKPGQVFVLSAHRRVQRSADTSFFAQNRDFLYLTGINEPDWLLVITADSEFLIEPKRSKIEIIFDGKTNTAEIYKRSGVKRVVEYDMGWDELNGHLRNADEVWVSSRDVRGATQINGAQKTLIRKIRARTKASVMSVHPLLDAHRAIKQPQEIRAIQKAIDLTGTALERVKKDLAAYTNEREIEADITQQFIRAGANGHAYDPIVAAGKNACTLHYIANDADLHSGMLLLLDVGAEYEHYAADITRTWAVQGSSQRARDVHRAVDEVRQHAIGLIKPGVAIRDYFAAVDKFMGLKLQELKLIKTISGESIREYFPHGVSHMLGLDVHDVPPDSDVFQEGMVLTVEPGIYIPKESIGIRIEDDIMVTKNGVKNLSEKIPHEL